MLHRGDSVHGYAIEAERHGGYCTGCAFLSFFPPTFIYVAKNSIPPPPPLPKFYSPDDSIMLEDESGRIQLVGKRAIEARLVTGVIIAALGIETPTGEFEVVDICYAEMAPQPMRNVEHEQEEMDVDGILMSFS